MPRSEVSELAQQKARWGLPQHNTFSAFSPQVVSIGFYVGTKLQWLRRSSILTPYVDLGSNGRRDTEQVNFGAPSVVIRYRLTHTGAAESAVNTERSGFSLIGIWSAPGTISSVNEPKRESFFGRRGDGAVGRSFVPYQSLFDILACHTEAGQGFWGQLRNRFGDDLVGKIGQGARELRVLS